MPGKEAIQQFGESLRGELILAGDAGYDEARKVYNGMIDKKPAMIAKCFDVADVISSVNFGRENNMLISVRGGGHNAGGLGICDDGLVIDLSQIRYTHVDPKAKTIRVGGGCQWGMSTTPGMHSACGSCGLFPQPALVDLLLVVVLAT